MLSFSGIERSRAVSSSVFITLREVSLTDFGFSAKAAHTETCFSGAKGPRPFCGCAAPGQ